MTKLHPTNPVTFFARTYVINLPERKDRKQAAKQELASIGVKSGEHHLQFYAAGKPTELCGFETLGAHGCFLSHLGALRDAAARNVESVLILEDDVRFPKNFTQQWPSVQAQLTAQPWDIVNVGFGSGTVEKVTKGAALHRSTEPLMLAHCYAVHGRALPALIAFLDLVLSRPEGHPLGGPMHFDGALFHFCQQNPEVIRLRPSHSLAAQRSSRSDIAVPRWFDRNPLLSRGVNQLRRLKPRR